jgi:hypothetical protein
MPTAQSGREPFDAALAQYLAKLSELSNALRERQQLALKDYLDAGAASDQPQQSDNSREYDNLLAALQSQNVSQIATAQAEYLESLRALRKRAIEAAQSSLNVYFAQIQSVWDSAQREVQVHQAQYVDAIKKGFASLPRNADSATLSAIGQSLMTAALYSAAANQPLPASERALKAQASAF